MSHTKAGGSVKNVHDSPGKRLGLKRAGGQIVTIGSIIVRQRGTRMEPGNGAALGSDQTIYATKSGVVRFSQRQVAKFTGQKVRRTFVSVVDE